MRDNTDDGLGWWTRLMYLPEGGFLGYPWAYTRHPKETLPMIREGRSFTESLESAGWIPPLALDMIGVGERSGSLREMLEEVADFHDRESEVRLEQLTTVLEPAILLVMGGVVVTILLSIYLPIIQSISNLSFRS